MSFNFSFLSNRFPMSDFLDGMTDVHTHLLPGVDDGVQKMNETLHTLDYMSSMGVKHVILTPHIMAEIPQNNPQRLKEIFEQTKAAVAGIISISLGGEYMLDAAFPSTLKKKEILQLGASHLLVETSYLSPPRNLEQLLYSIRIAGYTPVLAHPERYVYIHSDERFVKLKENGAKLQLNLFSLIGMYGRNARQTALRLIDMGLYDFTGTDTHRFEVYADVFDHERIRLSAARRREIFRIIENNSTLVDN
jgi:tyrosine-protein phosphatase YwqE